MTDFLPSFCPGWSTITAAEESDRTVFPAPANHRS